jgi:dihydrolipoamide dehydrogenase
MYRSLSHFIQSTKQHTSRYPQLVRYFASDTSKPYDVVVIGGGPGGYVCAIKASQLGLRTACIENRGSLGGTCLNVGCIPSKALLHASHMYHDANANFSKYGIDVPNDQISVNMKNLMAYKQKAVTGLTRGVDSLFKKNKVDYIKGKGTIQSNDTISVEKIDGSGIQEISTKNIVIATGSVPASLPGVDMDEKTVVSSTGALEFQEVSKHLVVIGACVIGLEMGSVWSRLGSKLTVVEFGDRITPGIDTEVATAVR